MPMTCYTRPAYALHVSRGDHFRGADVTSVWTTRGADVRVGDTTANKGDHQQALRRHEFVRERDHYDVYTVFDVRAA